MDEAVRHKSKWDERLRLCDLVDVLLELCFAFAGVSCGLLRLDDREDGAIGVVQAEVGEAVPGRLVVARDRYLEADLRVVTQIPLRPLQLRVDQVSACLGFVG